MKKWISLLLVLAIALSFAACGKETKSRRPATPVYNTNIPEANAAPQSDGAQPDSAQPDTVQPEAVPSDISAEEASQPDASAPAASQPGASAPNAPASNAAASNAAAPNASGEAHKEGGSAQNASANKDNRTGSVSVVNPISEYLAKSGLAQEMIIPGDADGAVVQNGELHFDPHGEDAATWFEVIEMAAAMVSDDGTISGTAQTGITYTVSGTTVTVTCNAASNDDWFLKIG